MTIAGFSRVSVGAIAGVVAVLTLSACSKAPEQLLAECASGTAHRLETGLDVPSVAFDKIKEQVIQTCADAFKATGDGRSAFGAGRAALTHKQWDISLDWFARATAAGYRADLTQFGVMTAYQGRAAAGDLDRALVAGGAAKAAGAMDAAVMLAEIFSNPSSGHFDFAAAVENYRIATKTESNGGYAAYRLAVLHLERGQSANSPNASMDLNAALRWSNLWAELEPQNADAWKLGGDIVSLDSFAGAGNHDKMAYENYRKAAELGDPEAAFKTASALYFGEGVAANTSASRPFFQTAAAAGDGRANYVLAHMYWSGNGADKNAPQAEKHALAAMEVGHVEAKALYEQSIKPVMTALRNGAAKSAQACMDGKRSPYNNTIFEVSNACAQTMNVLICENYALMDFIGLFQGKDNTSCRIKTVSGGGFVESMYFSEADAALGWQIISGSKLQWGACYAPLQPRFAADRSISCEW